MVNLVLQIEECGDFEDDVLEWTWADFQVNYADADRKRRLQNKIKKKMSKSAGYHSANMVVEAERTWRH